MSKPASRKPAKPKASLHARNRHPGRYDFDALCRHSPQLQSFLQLTPAGNQSIDFSNPAAIKTLNQALLMHWYRIRNWDIPDGYLCPPVPGRADYVHHIADLLAELNQDQVPRGPGLRVLDIGCGANCIYPIIGASEYGWRFTAADIAQPSLDNAASILAANPTLARQIDLRLQPDPQCYFTNVLQPAERLDLTLCNPPFHDSPDQMARGNRRKWHNLGKWDGKKQDPQQLNFGGQHNELWCEGGEVRFISDMIRESKQYGDRVLWFTSLVSRQAAVPALKRVVKDQGAAQYREVAMGQGQKVSRLIAWSFLPSKEQQIWARDRWAK